MVPESPLVGVLENIEATNLEHDWALVAINQEVALRLSIYQSEKTTKSGSMLERPSNLLSDKIASNVSGSEVWAIVDDVIPGTISPTLCSVKFGTRFVDHWSVRLQGSLGVFLQCLYFIYDI
jgi:hypothetical protein